MYDWLGVTLDDSTCLVTANRRLTRLLTEAWGETRIERGEVAWRTPDIQPWHGWLVSVIASSDDPAQTPTYINANQSQVLWDRCLRKELDDSVTGLPALVRLARDAWQRLADARVGIRELARSAGSDDQRLFAAVAGRYLAVLEHERWADDAGLGDLVLSLIREGRVPLKSRYVFAGFDRLRPIVTAIQEALREAGSEVVIQQVAAATGKPVVHEFEHRDAELRAAGAWARGIVDEHPAARVAVIVQGLENSAERDLRLLRDGFVPGWQYGPMEARDAVNVSYGGRLSEYPAVNVALLLLRWLVRELSATEVSLLLRSPLLGRDELAARSRLELHLRQLPDRAWEPSMITAALRGRGDAEGASDWLAMLAAFSKRRRALPQYAAPADWVIIIDEVLSGFGWPGPGSSSSDSFQLVNRWRELLNEFARLEIVSSSMSATGAIGQLEFMAGETVFQPESRQAAVQLMGPLEASGAEFDAIWISGLTANNWPPAGNPTALVSKALQREHEMPDATPEDTRAWAATTLERLTSAAPVVVCSYALLEDDVEQTVSDLLADGLAVEPAADPGWHAAELTGRVETHVVADSVPPVIDERVHGGATTVQRQLSEPFSAFASGRLGVRTIDRQALGVPPLLRGNLVHDALYRLYQDLPSSSALCAIGDKELRDGVHEAVEDALQRHRRNADPVLLGLLALERERIEQLVAVFVRIDRERDDFQVAAVEGDMQFQRGSLRLNLRFDRIDRYADGGVAIIDYKTGAAKKLLRKDGTVNEVQLFVYAGACTEPVVALALANIDSRETGFSGAGRGFTDEAEWPELLAGIGAEINSACDSLVAGDVRLVAEQGATNARPLNLLSRYTELRHED